MTPNLVSQRSQPPVGGFSPGASFLRLIARGRALLAPVAIAAVAINPAFGQTAPVNPTEVPAKAPALELQKFTVTGSNIQMTAADADKGALPVNIISNGRFQLSNAESFSD